MGGDVDAAIETYKTALRDEVAYLKSSGVADDNICVRNFTYRTTVSVDNQIIVEYIFDYNAKAPSISESAKTLKDIGSEY